jgi:hypothetical protein
VGFVGADPQSLKPSQSVTFTWVNMSCQMNGFLFAESARTDVVFVLVLFREFRDFSYRNEFGNLEKIEKCSLHCCQCHRDVLPFLKR